MKTYRTGLILSLALLTAGLLNACDQAKSPDQVAKDTAAAETTAAKDTAKVEQKAADKVNNAQDSVRDEQATEAHTRAVESEKVNVSLAEGNRKIALAQCGKLNGDDQKSCEAQANAAYETAVAQAKQAKVDTDPKP